LALYRRIAVLRDPGGERVINQRREATAAIHSHMAQRRALIAVNGKGRHYSVLGV
jgi:hypothetical protein